MQWIDVVILAIIVLSALISVMRGFVKEMLSLVAWVVAFFVAATFYGNLAGLFTFIDNDMAKIALALFVLFIGTLMAIGVVNLIISLILKKTGLSGTDRILGVIFGAARGLLIVICMCAVIQMLLHYGLFKSIETSEWYSKAVVLPEFNRVSTQLLKYFGLIS